MAVRLAAFRDQSLAAGAALLPVLDEHVIETAQLPLLHHDPFDRLLIAQARVEGLMAVSSDGHWPGYHVSLHRGRVAKSRLASPDSGPPLTPLILNARARFSGWRCRS